MPSQPPEKKVQMWLPTTQTKVTVVGGEVKIWDEITMEKRVLQKRPGFKQDGENDSVAS